MNKVAKFEKVSLEQFTDSIESNHGLRWTQEEAIDMYSKLQLPTRATTGSAGYDFKSPFHFELCQGKAIVIPTGIRCQIDTGWWLALFPRSGHGFKTMVRLANTVAVIDSDFFQAKNEGHIMIKLTHSGPTKRKLIVEQGDSFAQGVFLPYGVTVDDTTVEQRIGGLGSTNYQI